VKQSAFPVPQRLKIDLLMELLRQQEMKSVLIFTRTKIRTERLARQLEKNGFEATRLHGDRTQGQRLAALEGFRNREYRILVATDIAARGIDVEGISHVVNFDVPVAPEDYVHRIGRTARAQALGEAMTLVAPEEEDFLHAIQRLTKIEIPRQQLAGFDYRKPTEVRVESRERPRGATKGHGFAKRRSSFSSENGKRRGRRRPRPQWQN
jgi:ATP-dependent RNA helicase RhlE